MSEKQTVKLNELAEVVADLSIELKILETRVERLSEFCDAVGHVPIYENGGKQ